MIIQIFLAMEVFLPLFSNYKSALFILIPVSIALLFSLLIGWGSKLCFQYEAIHSSVLAQEHSEACFTKERKRERDRERERKRRKKEKKKKTAWKVKMPPDRMIVLVHGIKEMVSFLSL